MLTGLTRLTALDSFKFDTSTAFSPIPGTYNDRLGLMAIENCTDCPRGKFCGREGLTQPSGDCYGGHYCTERSKSPAPEKDLLAKNYSDYVNFPFPYLNDACPPGHFCPNGSDPEPCPSGTFHNEGGISNRTQCHPCPVGRYCNGSGTLSGTAPPCDAGYVCTGGSSQPKPTHPSMGYICPRGFHCPTGKIRT